MEPLRTYFSYWSNEFPWISVPEYHLWSPDQLALNRGPDSEGNGGNYPGEFHLPSNGSPIYAKSCYSGVPSTYCVGCKSAGDPSYDPSVDCLYIWALMSNTYQPVRYYRSECLKVYDEADCNSIEKLQCLNDLPEPDIDIKFCSNPNAFNCKKKGVVPVTIFGSYTFDVSNIDLSTVMLCLASDADCSNGLQALHAQSPIDRGDPTTDLGTDTCTDGIATLDTFAEIDVVFDAREVAELIGCDGLNRNDSSETLVIKGMLLDGKEFESIPQDDIGIDQLVIMNK